MQGMDKPIILFDFDGVIVDSFATAFTASKMLHPDMTAEEYRTRFEGNINIDNGAHRHTAACHHERDIFFEYTSRMKDEVTVVPGMADALSILNDHFRMIIISSMTSGPIADFLRIHNLDRYFMEIMGNDIHESKIEKINMAFAKHDAQARDCVFVTDTLGDFYEAARVGVGAIGVSWGYHERERLHREQFFRIVDQPVLLPQAIADYFAMVVIAV